MELRALSWVALEEARQARLRRAVQLMRELAELPERRGGAEEGDEREHDPLAEYDLLTLLRHGVAAWSYDAEVSEATLADLDERTARWAGRELLPGLAGGDERLKG
jgi:hypothetical protein